ncbi:hypothetical protein ACLB1G_18915 [Oxalobacteraceae bacterium A2-2]
MPEKPYLAQVVGVQWLNPLHRRDYSTEWELLWTLGLVKPNVDDDMVKSHPHIFSSIRNVASIVAGDQGTTTFANYQKSYFHKLTSLFHDIYFMDSNYFYNAHSLKDRSTWRELAGIHVEYALPAGKLDAKEARDSIRDRIIDAFEIGNVHLPTTWSRSTPPDVNVTMGGANAGFTSLSLALDYLKAHPAETVWVLNWDAPSRPLDEQINENLVLLVLAGPQYDTKRAALAWIGYPASGDSAGYPADHALPGPVRAWSAVFDAAARNANKQITDIGYAIHDAGNAYPSSSERIGPLAQAITTLPPRLDFMAQTFNTSALLGDMGAGSALTNVALAIGYANHMGRNVMVAGATEAGRPVAVMVVPPAVVRPIRPDQKWFRARGANYAYLPWWGIRHDAPPRMQGFSN